jgi:putative transposase
MAENPWSNHQKNFRRYNLPGQAHELTFSCQKRYQLLNKDRTRNWLVEAVRHARRRWNFQVWAYVIMPEHVHLLLYPLESKYDVGDWEKSIKQSVSRRAIGFLRANSPEWLEKLKVVRPGGRIEYRFWLQGSGYDRNVDNAKTAWSCVEYFHLNPVRRGLVTRAVDWPWSSARWYERLDDVKLEMDACPPDPG